jgi:hypothetical protein
MPLKVSDGIGAWIKDFQKSDAPQFKNSSREERRDQAIAAYLSAKGESVEENVSAPRTPAHRRAMMVGVNRAKEKQKDAEKVLGPGAKPIKKVKNSDGTTQSGISRARTLAKDQITSKAKRLVNSVREMNEKVEYAEYQFKNRKHAEKAHEYLKSVQRQGLNVEDDSIHHGQLRVDADDKEKNKDISQHHNHIMKNFPGVKATHVESYKVKLKGFGPDNAKGNMGNPSARAALNPMRSRSKDNEKARQALKDPSHNPAWANSKTPKSILAGEARDPSKSGGSGYDLYHKDFSSAMKHAYDHSKNKLGVHIDPKEIDDKVASGPRKPSKGKTNRYRLMGKDGKKAVQIQVHGMDNGKYELNMYKESVELDEGKKRYDISMNVGKAKHVVKFHDGKKKHNDGSDFFDMRIFNNKPDLEKFEKELKSKGYVKESVELDETSSTKAKQAMKDRIERQAASYTTQASYNRRADKSRAEVKKIRKKQDALPDHHKPRSSGGDYFKGSDEYEKLDKKADAHNFDAHYYNNKAKEAGERGDKQGNKIGRSQDRAYPTLGKTLKAKPDHYRANRIADKQVDKMRDKHFATTTDYDIRTGKEIRKAGGKQHSQYPKPKTPQTNSVQYESVVEAVDPKKVVAHLVKKGSNPKDAEKMVAKHFKYATNKYRASDVSKIADVIMSLGEAVLAGKHYKVKDGKVHISRANFSKVHKDYKNATKGKERMTVLDPKSQATVSAPVVFEAKDMYKSAAQELKTYADKSGGMDKKDFHAAAKNIESIGRASILQKGQLLAKFSKQLRDLDTSPREKILSVLNKHGHQVGDFMPGVTMKKSFRREGVQEGSLERLKMIRKAGEKYNKEKKAAARKAERDAKRGIKQDPDLVEPQTEEFTMKQYRKNEDENKHTENGVALVNKFGTSAENIKMGGIAARHNMRGSISRKDQQDRDALIKKYYPRLTK